MSSVVPETASFSSGSGFPSSGRDVERDLHVVALLVGGHRAEEVLRWVEAGVGTARQRAGAGERGCREHPRDADRESDREPSNPAHTTKLAPLSSGRTATMAPMTLGLALLVVVVAILAAILIFLVVQRRLTEPLLRDPGRGSPTISLVGTAFAVLLAFLTVAAFGTYNGAKAGAESEATAVLELSRARRRCSRPPSATSCARGPRQLPRPPLRRPHRQHRADRDASDDLDDQRGGGRPAARLRRGRRAALSLGP